MWPGGIGAWLICGDFNLVYKAENKSNGRLNRCLMGKFRRLLQDLELSELHLHGRLYTWSNEQLHPTLERIDRKFSYLQWSEQFPQHWLRATSSAYSDHAPLLLHTNTNTTAHKRFMFETICPRFPGYLDAVASSCEGSKTATRGGVNESQSKLLTGTWTISQNQPDAPPF
jgi:hypothetical protein